LASLQCVVLWAANFRQLRLFEIHRADYSEVLAPLINLMNSSLVSKRPSCLVNCSIASQGCMLLSVRRNMVTAS